MTLVTFYFFAHQPMRLLPYEYRRVDGVVAPEKLFDLYFDEDINSDVFRKVTEKCYRPATQTILDLIEAHKKSDKPFKVAYALSGTFLESAKRYDPKLLDIFKKLADTGMVEFTGENYYHSVSSLFGTDRSEFCAQIQKHKETIRELFGQETTFFRNTECLYNDNIAAAVQGQGFEGILTEGVDWLMEYWRSPDFVYQAPCGLPVLLRNYKLSDDIGYRFPNKNWDGYPLKAEKFAGWLADNTDMCVTLAMDYEAFGEHIWEEMGIFDFLRSLPDAIKEHPQLEFSTPTETVRRLPSVGTITIGDFQTISWADQERNTSAWLGNEMQQFAFEELKRLDAPIKATENEHFLHAWRLMQTSDHLYYLATKAMTDGNVHEYFSSYRSVFEGFVRLYSALMDIHHRADRLLNPNPLPE